MGVASCMSVNGRGLLIEHVFHDREMERYFKPIVPAPHGELAKFVPSKSIKEANKAVEALLSKESGRKRQEYQKVSTE